MPDEVDPQNTPTFDSLIQRVKDLEDGLRMHRHTGFDLTQKLFGTPISRPVFTDAAVLGDGASTSGTLTLQRATGRGDTFIRAVINASDWTNAAAKTGFIFGIDDTAGVAKFFFGSGTSYIKFDGTSVTVAGSLTASTLNIPDTTTASSFHVDSSGNAWWGANVASGLANANASITSAGLATFKNILIGGATIQYQVTNAGIFTFGDGSDGTATFDGSATPSGATKSGNDYTLTRDVYYTNMTVSTGCTVNPAGWRIFGTGTLTLNGTGKVFRNGNDGTSGVGTAKGSGGAALADGYLKGSAAGGDGGRGGNFGGGAESAENGVNGANTANSIGSNGQAGGNGGTRSGGGAGGTGGLAGTATTSNVKLIANWHLATLLDIGSTGATVKFDNSAGAGGGGGGGRNDSGGGAGGGGGGSGSAGGIVAIYFRAIVIGASASITANGGNAGSGASGVTNSGGGGGGSGGNGGQVILIYNTISNSGSLSASGGSLGAAGSGAGTGGNGSAGIAGSAGTIRQFQVSL